ncbi:ABC transporter substrate-binding protein [Roseomonas sp. OT10]|uniref:ABC transporter substrate-binding protein n=1 Tax=Roseomonas cutis TaxID=2897332 RepID=UPI001E59335F|nr:ABC transporter substrate-binding protein [Roseomonas sp. OT10]UFN48319.1 ABC transporter substrate-binding protein [Roseomonas sp. OT10]
MQRRDLLLSASLLALAPTLSTPARAAKRGGTLTFARYADCIFLDPVNTAQNADIWISLNLYDTLLQPELDGKGGTQAGLAESYAFSDEGRTLTFKMRPGIRFADGSPITVGDVKWSLDRARGKETGGEFAFLLAAIGEIETQGDDTVILRMARPDPAILQALATFNAGIMSEKLLMAAPGANLAEKSKAFAEKPVGSGPFVLESWRRNSEMVLKRNPYYWKKGEDGQPLPYLDTIRFLIIPDDATRILKLRAGEVDATEFVPYARVAELKADPKLNMVLFPAAQVQYFTLNTRPTLSDGSKNPLSDVRVRQALNYATNKQALIQVVTHGVGSPQHSFMPMSTPHAYGPEPAYPYNLAKAKQLMAEAGYPNGGFEVTCMALAGSADDAAKLATLQQMWSQLGVRLKIEQLENATRQDRFNNYRFQMRTSLWTNDLNDPKQITSIMAYYPTRQSNRTGWNDEVTNELFRQSEVEMDPAKRGEMYRTIQQRFMAAAPYIFGMEVPYPVAMTKRVHDFVQIPLGNNIFLNAWVDG